MTDENPIRGAGVQASHGSSLADLLAQHALVKVQLNAASANPPAVGAQLADAAGATDPPTSRLCRSTLSCNSPSHAWCYAVVSLVSKHAVP